jgi:hypothetical protein
MDRMEMDLFSYYNTFELALRVIHIECTSWFFHHMPEAHYHISQFVLVYLGSTNYFDHVVPE